MSQTLRHPDILAIARAEGRVTVDDLADRLGVTAQTIRRDLSELAEAGRLERVHGGAVLPSGVSNIAYEERRRLNDAAKRRIAARCVADVTDGAALMLNIGTTTEAVAQALMERDNLLVVSNNLNVATILLGHPGCEVVVTGGTLRPADGGLTGPLAEESIRRFRPDLAIIGCSALDASGEMLDFDLQEVAVSRAIMAQARRVALVADASKFQRTAPARIASLEEIDVIYTDAPLPGALVQACRDWGTEVIVA